MRRARLTCVIIFHIKPARETDVPIVVYFVHVRVWRVDAYLRLYSPSSDWDLGHASTSDRLHVVNKWRATAPASTSSFWASSSTSSSPPSSLVKHSSRVHLGHLECHPLLDWRDRHLMDRRDMELFWALGACFVELKFMAAI